MLTSFLGVGTSATVSANNWMSCMNCVTITQFMHDIQLLAETVTVTCYDRIELF